LQDLLALLVLVMHGGLVQQQMVVLADPLSQEELSNLAGRLNHRFEGMTASQIDAICGTFQDGVERDVAETIVRLMYAHDQQDTPVVHYDGLANILGQPEFSDQRLPMRGQPRQQVAESMLHMLDLLQQGILFRRLLPQVAEGNGVQVFIGGEGEHDDLRQYSVIVSRYGVAGGGSGMLGVLGPTRMHYGRAVSVVRFMTELLTELAGELNG
jgi:heat-inducible transcriptional repressor